jgi:hypothetical protein
MAICLSHLAGEPQFGERLRRGPSRRGGCAAPFTKNLQFISREEDDMSLDSRSCDCRRLLLAAAAALAVSVSLGTAAMAADPPAGEKKGPFQMCVGKYALCDAAACTPIPEQQGYAGPPKTQPSHALCECVVETGQNLGPGPCSNRTPAGKHGEYIMSTYSFALADHPYLSCPGGGARTVCFGFPCIVDEKHPDRAHCTCPITYDSGPFMTQGGGCDVASCTSGLWQGGTAKDYAVLNRLFEKESHPHQTPPPNCPAGARP